MGQEFHVVRCFACEIFQVQQVKKANKWSCKVCGQKQSLLKEFGRGSGADCRRHVQKLNAMRGAALEEQMHDTWLLCEQEETNGEEEPEDRDDQTQVSRWSKYLDTPEEMEQEEEEEEDVLMDRQHHHGNNMTDRKRKRTDTPEQSSCSGLKRTRVRASAPRTVRPTGDGPENLSSPRTCPGARWTPFSGSNCQVQEGEESCASGRSQPMDGATSLSCGDIITRPRPLLPVSSLFEMGEEFSADVEEFLTDQRV